MINTKIELRLYSFVNFYFSDIQKGIQTGHMAVDLVREYTSPDVDSPMPAQRMVAEWADNWKTFIVLNGGNNAMLDNAAVICSRSGLPWTTFYEDEQSLGGIRTCVGVVVPANYFNATYSSVNVESVEFEGRIIFNDPSLDIPPHNSDQVIFDLIKLLKTSRLA